MAEIGEIYQFLSEEIGVAMQKFCESTDIYSEFGMDGDDCFGFEEYFSEKFSVDMSNFIWYFHHGEEGVFSIGGLFFKPPYSRVARIPITPKVLLDSANKGTWSVVYPDHTIPKKRYDLAINKISLILFAVIVLFVWIKNL